MRIANLAWAVCVVAIAALIALWMTQPQPSQQETKVAGVAIGGPFTLTDHNGNAVTQTSWPGQYLLVYFGFTHCPDVCPLGLNTMTEALNKTPEKIVARIQPLFITVDPARDTAQALREYMPLFHKKLLGLTGTEAQIAAVEKAYRVYAEKQGTGADYMVNHSAFTYLMGPDGTLLKIWPHKTSADEMADDFKTLVK